MDRKLSLRRETLTELSTGELAMIAGCGPEGPPNPTPPVWAPTHNCPTNYCVPLTDACPSVLC